MPQPHPGIWPLVLIVCVVAVVLAALWVRWQSDRKRFALLKLAIEKGLTSLPLGLPIWLVSLRQGVLVFVAGLATIVAGGLTLRTAGTIPAVSGHYVAGPLASPQAGPQAAPHTTPGQPTTRIASPSVAATQPKSVPYGSATQATPPITGNPASINAGQWNGPDRGAGGSPRGIRYGSRSGNFPWPRPPGMRPYRGRPFGPPFYIRHAHDVMVRQNAGLALLGVGLVLCLLGLVRIIFAFIERRYTNDRFVTS